MTKKYYLSGIDAEPTWEKPAKITIEDHRITACFEKKDIRPAAKKVRAFFRNNKNDHDINRVSLEKEKTNLIFKSKTKFSNGQIEKIKNILDPLDNYLTPIRMLTVKEGVRVDSLITPLKKAIVNKDIVVSSKNELIFIGFRKNSLFVESDEVLSLIDTATAQYHPSKDSRFVSQQDSENMAAFKTLIGVNTSQHQPQTQSYSILVCVVTEMKRARAEILKKKNFYDCEGTEKIRFRYLKQKDSQTFDCFTEFYFSAPPIEVKLEEIKAIFKKEKIEEFFIEWKHHYIIRHSNKKIQKKISNAIKQDLNHDYFNHRTIEGNLEVTAKFDSLTKEEFLNKISIFLTEEKNVEFRPHKETNVTEDDISIISEPEFKKTVFQIDLKSKKNACSEKEKKRIKELEKNKNVLKIYRKESKIFIETTFESFSHAEIFNIFSKTDKEPKADKVFEFKTEKQARDFYHSVIDFNKQNDELPTFITRVKKRLAYVEACKEGEISQEDSKGLYKLADRFDGTEVSEDNLPSFDRDEISQEASQELIDFIDSNIGSKKLNINLNSSLQAIVEPGLFNPPKKRKEIEREGEIIEQVQKNQKTS